MNNFLRTLLERKNKNVSDKKNNNTMTKIISVIIAVIIWMYVIGEVNPEIVSEIKNVEVKLVNVEKLAQSGLVIMDQDYYSVNIKVRGRRSEILNITPSDINAIADMRGFGKGQNSVPVEINLSSNYQLEGINPTQLKVTIDEVVSRPKPVEIEFTGTAASGYIQGTPTVSTPEILVSGPETYVESVSKLVATISLNDTIADISKRITFRMVDNEGEEVLGVSAEDKFVDVYVPILRVKSVPIEVETLGRPAEGYELLSVINIPSRVEIMGRQDQIDSITRLTANPVSLEGITKTQDMPLQVNLPEGIQLVDAKPPKIKAFVEKIIIKEIMYNWDEIIIEGLDENLKAELLDDYNVKVIVEDIESTVEKVTKEDITISLDLSDLDEGEHSAKLIWTSVKELKTVRVEPNYLDVRVSKK